VCVCVLAVITTALARGDTSSGATSTGTSTSSSTSSTSSSTSGSAVSISTICDRYTAGACEEVLDARDISEHVVELVSQEDRHAPLPASAAVVAAVPEVLPTPASEKIRFAIALRSTLGELEQASAADGLAGDGTRGGDGSIRRRVNLTVTRAYTVTEPHADTETSTRRLL
jgi:hypothetical protein